MEFNIMGNEPPYCHLLRWVDCMQKISCGNVGVVPVLLDGTPCCAKLTENVTAELYARLDRCVRVTHQVHVARLAEDLACALQDKRVASIERCLVDEKARRAQLL